MTTALHIPKTLALLHECVAAYCEVLLFCVEQSDSLDTVWANY